ncbi:MAG TPA: calcium-binding protein [Spirochaetia bacterium]|nr:calcium-binding protein [Spirochaetia bacterium]
MKEDKKREKRIADEIVVDAYDEEERAMGWYYYLQDNLKFPFQAKCVKERSISPLKKNEIVTVIELPDEAECTKEMFVTIEWQNRQLAVPLNQLQGIKTDQQTKTAIEDWHYWKEAGYGF